MDETRVFRSGKLAKGSESPIRKFKDPESQRVVPMMTFQMTSSFEIGFGQSKVETTTVQLIGQEVIDLFQTAQPNENDDIRIKYAIIYVSNEPVIRVTSKEQLELIKKCDANIVSAESYFKELFK